MNRLKFIQLDKGPLPKKKKKKIANIVLVKEKLNIFPIRSGIEVPV